MSEEIDFENLTMFRKGRVARTLTDAKAGLFCTDASSRFDDDIPEDFLLQVQRIGVIGRQTSSPVANYTHPDTFTELGRLGVISDTSTINDYKCTIELCGCILFWANTVVVQSDILNRFMHVRNPKHASDQLVQVDSRLIILMLLGIHVSQD